MHSNPVGIKKNQLTITILYILMNNVKWMNVNVKNYKSITVY